MFPPPNGYTEINAVFGNPANTNGSLNHAWQAANIAPVTPPPGWQLYYQDHPGAITPINGLSMHVKLHDSFRAVLGQIWNHVAGIVGPATPDIQTYLHQNRLDLTAGCFNFRPNTSNPHVLSMHSYGIAVDWDAVNNPRGKPMHQTLPDWWYAIWNANGWSDGRHFGTPDPMHVQYATGA